MRLDHLTWLRPISSPALRSNTCPVSVKFYLEILIFNIKLVINNRHLLSNSLKCLSSSPDFNLTFTTLEFFPKFSWPGSFFRFSKFLPWLRTFQVSHLEMRAHFPEFGFVIEKERKTLCSTYFLKSPWRMKCLFSVSYSVL